MKKQAAIGGAAGRTAIAAGILLAASACWVYRDYRSWLKLGSGGLPSNFKGWLQTTRWRLQQRSSFDLRDLRSAQRTGGEVTCLANLPHRSTPRPKVDPHPVPHRQLTQQAAPHVIEALQAVFDRAIAENEGKVTYALSHFERHNQAITCCLANHTDPVQGSSHGEIAHVHAHDGSMHMILSPADAIAAVEAGWAERHGLSGKVLGLPATYMLVYAPQNLDDVAIAARLLAAAISYMTGADLSTVPG